MNDRIATKLLRRVLLPADDRARAPNSKSPVMGASVRWLVDWARTSERNLVARYHDWTKAQAAGTTTPPGAVNMDDWTDLARWLLEHRRAAKVGANDSPTVDGRHLAWKQVRLEVAQFMGLFREMFGMDEQDGG